MIFRHWYRFHFSRFSSVASLIAISVQVLHHSCNKSIPCKSCTYCKKQLRTFEYQGFPELQQIVFSLFSLDETKKLSVYFCFVQSILYSIFFLVPFSMMPIIAMPSGPGGNAPSQTAHSACLCGRFPACQNRLPQT